MMENPAHWGEAERVVAQALDEWNLEDEELCGLSLPRRIVNELENAGLLRAKRPGFDPANYPWTRRRSVRFPW